MYSLGRVERKEDRVLKLEMSLSLLNKCTFPKQFQILILNESISEKMGLEKINDRYNLVRVVGSLWTKGKSSKTHFYLKVPSLTESGKKSSKFKISLRKRIKWNGFMHFPRNSQEMLQLLFQRSNNLTLPLYSTA